MNSTQWIIFILIVQIIHFLGTWKLYVKAGRKAWEAAIPVYNAIVLMQIIRRPKWWVVLLFIPIINLLMFPVVWVETIRSFGKNSLVDTWLVILTLGFYIYYINYTQDVSYIADRSTNPKTALGEWVSSIVFAVVAATFVHTYFIQPFVIPTGSLEKTLLIGDFLFVSKFHYGARTPITAVAAPMVHDTLPIIKTRSYVADVNPETAANSWKNKLRFPYFRLPALQKVKNNDIVVFSWPADTVYQFFERRKGVLKPIDKKSNYVKRCVAIPGDSLSIINGYVHINGKQIVLPERAKPQHMHVVTVAGPRASSVYRILGRKNYINGARIYRISNTILNDERTPDLLADGTSFTKIDEDASYGYFIGGISSQKQNLINYLKPEPVSNKLIFNLTAKEAAEGAKKEGISSIQKVNYTNKDTSTFPQNPQYPGTMDNFGPIYVPKAGTTVPLNTSVLPLYKRILSRYEGNTISVSGNQVLLNGEVANSYTFKKDYYWMMGDNRHSSEDSRVWGYVPEDHIVGKPVFIWMSIDGINDGISNWSFRWDRVFTTVGGDGEPRSYFKYFLMLLAGWFVFDFFRKKRKKKAKS